MAIATQLFDMHATDGAWFQGGLRGRLIQWPYVDDGFGNEILSKSFHQAWYFVVGEQLNTQPITGQRKATKCAP